MQNPVAMQTAYSEHQSQMAWVNENDWQFERPAKKHPVRQALATALIALANMLTPATKRESQTVQ